MACETTLSSQSMDSAMPLCTSAGLGPAPDAEVASRSQSLTFKFAVENRKLNVRNTNAQVAI